MRAWLVCFAEASGDLAGRLELVGFDAFGRVTARTPFELGRSLPPETRRVEVRYAGRVVGRGVLDGFHGEIEAEVPTS